MALPSATSSLTSMARMPPAGRRSSALSTAARGVPPQRNCKRGKRTDYIDENNGMGAWAAKRPAHGVRDNRSPMQMPFAMQ